MNAKTTAILPILLAAALGASSFFFYQSGVSEKRVRLLKENELTRKSIELAGKEAQIEDLNKRLEDLKETTAKRINSLEMAARDREETARNLRDEVEGLKKEKDTAANEMAKKDQEIARLNDQLSVLQSEKQELGAAVEELKNQLAALTAAQAAQEASTEAMDPAKPRPTIRKKPRSEPYGTASDVDEGLKIDVVRLGKIVLVKDSGRAARVQEVNSLYNFIIINAGEQDGLRQGRVINLVRDENLIGKALIKYTRANASAALVLPEWKKAVPEPGDFITEF